MVKVEVDVIDYYFADPECKQKTKERLHRQKLQKYDPSICLEAHSVCGLQEAQLRLINLIYNTLYFIPWLLGPYAA